MQTALQVNRACRFLKETCSLEGGLLERLLVLAEMTLQILESLPC